MKRPPRNGESTIGETSSAVAMTSLDLAERRGRTEDDWCATRSDAIPVDFRDKVVAAGLALGTVLMPQMLGLGAALVFALAVMAPVLSLRPVRARLFPAGRETFGAYYVAWLYGPLGWGLYRRVRWAQVVGVGVLLVVVMGVM